MNRALLIIPTLVALAAGCQYEVDTYGAATDTPPVVEYINPRSPADGEVAPFSGAVRVGNTLYVSGMLGLEGGQVPETAEQEATNVLDNVKSVLETAGLTMDDLVVVQVYASDVGDYGAFNSVYRTYFTTEFPARAFLGSGTLLFGARFEVMGIAVRRAAAETEAETG